MQRIGAGGSAGGFKAEWVPESGTTPVHAQGPNHAQLCGCAPSFLFDIHPEAHREAAARHEALSKSPEAVQAGVDAWLGYKFDTEAMAAGVKTSLGKFISADTTNPPGNEGRIADMIAARIDDAATRLQNAGIKAKVTEFAPGRKNLVATLKGSGEEAALVLMAHMDVVPTDGQKWTVPPHELTEKDGILYGRGTRDDLVMVAANLEIFLELAKAKVPLKRDIILVLTGDEETHSAGAIDVLKTSPEIAKAGLVINEGSAIVNGGSNTAPVYCGVEVAQKRAQDFIISTVGEPGHSAYPLKGKNAIGRLAKALAKIDIADRPARMIDATRAMFKSLAPLQKDQKLANAMNALADAQGDLPADAVAVIDAIPNLYPLLRTTLEQTLISGGTKNNVRPFGATANVNGRIMSDETVPEILTWLTKIIDDPEVTITLGPDNFAGPSSVMHGPFFTALETALGSVWPGTPIVKSYAPGFTDIRLTRALNIPGYGFNPFPGTTAELLSMHGADERIQASGLKPGMELYTKLILQLAAKPAA